MGCLDLQSKVSNELDKIEQKISSLYTYRRGMIREVKRLHARRKNNRIEIENLTIKISSSRDSVKKGYQQYNDVRKSRSTLLSEIRDIRSKIKTIENDLRVFEKNSSLKENIDLVEELKSADLSSSTRSMFSFKDEFFSNTLKSFSIVFIFDLISRISDNKVLRDFLTSLYCWYPFFTESLEELIFIVRFSISIRLFFLRACNLFTSLIIPLL